MAMIILSFPSPPTGALSVPVVNCRNSLFCSSENEWTISQNSLRRKHTTGLVWRGRRGVQSVRGPRARAASATTARWGTVACERIEKNATVQKTKDGGGLDVSMETGEAPAHPVHGERAEKAGHPGPRLTSEGDRTANPECGRAPREAHMASGHEELESGPQRGVP